MEEPKDIHLQVKQPCNEFRSGQLHVLIRFALFLI